LRTKYPFVRSSKAYYAQHNFVHWILQQFFIGAFLLSLGSVVFIGVLTARAEEIIYFGARVDVPPFSFKRGDNWMGYSVELCNRIFEQYRTDIGMGSDELILKFEQVDANNRFKLLESPENKIQALCGATTVTINRMKDHHFTLLTFVSGASVMKRRETDVGQLSRPLNKYSNVKVSFVGDTTTEDHVKRLLGGAVITKRFNNHIDAFAAFENDKVDFYFGDRLILRQFLLDSKNPEKYLLAPGFLSYEPYAIAIRKENNDLWQAANAVLAEIFRKGEIKVIYRKWFENAQKSALLKALFELNKIPE